MFGYEYCWFADRFVSNSWIPRLDGYDYLRYLKEEGQLDDGNLEEKKYVSG